MGWENIACVLVGIVAISFGIFAKNGSFHVANSEVLMPNWVGRMWFIGLGAVFLAVGLFVHSWK